VAFTWSGISAARARLEKLARGLEQVAGGTVLERAGAKVAEQVRSIARDKLAAHEMSGTAASLTVVSQSGGLVTLHGMPPRNAKNGAGRSYVSIFAWWPFRRGMPQNVVKRAAQIFAAEVLLSLGGRGTALGSLAGEVEDEAAEGAKRSAERKALVATPAGKAAAKAKAAANKAARALKAPASGKP
jgi:hypothetical protein